MVDFFLKDAYDTRGKSPKDLMGFAQTLGMGQDSLWLHHWAIDNITDDDHLAEFLAEAGTPPLSTYIFDNRSPAAVRTFLQRLIPSKRVKLLEMVSDVSPFIEFGCFSLTAWEGAPAAQKKLLVHLHPVRTVLSVPAADLELAVMLMKLMPQRGT